MNSDTISRAQLLEEIKRRRNQGIIGKVEAARWEKIVETFPDAKAPAPEPAEIPEAKSLRWLTFNFPFTPNPEDETDRISNAIHVYAQRGAAKIEALAYALAMAGVEQPPTRTRFERIKAAGTPEAMAVELNANTRRFCPKEYAKKPPNCIIPCGECITKWLREEAAE